MSNGYGNQHFQTPQGLQPAIPFERPPPQSRTPLRTRVETPIHPPPIPPSRAPQPTPARQRPQQPHQPQQPQHPPQVQQAPQTRPPVPPSPSHQQLQSQQADLDEQFRQAEQTYLATYHPNARQHAVYHTIDPTRTTLSQGPPYVLYRPPPREAAQPPQNHQGPEPQQRRRRQDARFVHTQPPPPLPQQPSAPQPVTPQQLNQQNQGQASHARAQDETMQEDESESDEQEGDDNDGNQDDDGNDGDGTPRKPTRSTRHVQPVTPLHYPAVRPTLLLGPYETREEAVKAVIEYGVTQGYMLVLSGSCRSKTSWSGNEEDRPVVRLDYMCDRSGTFKSTSTGKRKRTSHKTDCPTRIKVVCRKRDGCKWFIDPRCELHNHDLNVNDMDTIASYRRWRRLQQGGSSSETREERSERMKKGRNPTLPAPVPAPVFHNPGPQPPADPTGPVHMAALKGQVKILEILLNRGGDINAYDSTGRTALHCALAGSRMDAFRLLINRGADVTRCDTKGLSPLRMAVEKGMEDAVVTLIEKGADPNK